MHQRILFLPSIFDGLGMGLGFTIALSLLGGFREILGAGTILGINIPHWDSIGIFVMAPGAFFVLAALIAIQNQIRISHGKSLESFSANRAVQVVQAVAVIIHSVIKKKRRKHKW